MRRESLSAQDNVVQPVYIQTYMDKYKESSILKLQNVKYNNDSPLDLPLLPAWPCKCLCNTWFSLQNIYRKHLQYIIEKVLSYHFSSIPIFAAAARVTVRGTEVLPQAINPY